MNTRTLNKYLCELGDPDETKRRTAATTLAEADERAIYPLIKALRDQNPGVQDAAIHSLIAIGGETVAYMVLPLLRQEPVLRNSAILILQALGRESVPFLYPLLKDKDEDVRKFALDMMSEIKDDVLPEAVVPSIKDPNPNVRAAALKVIGVLGYKAALAEVIEALGDAEEWVGFAALETLGVLGESVPVDKIMLLLNNDAAIIRLAAIETLGLLASEEASEALLVHIRRASVGDEERLEAVRSLVRIGLTPGMEEVSEYLIKMWRDGDWDERMVALKGMADLSLEAALFDIADIGGSLDTSNPDDEELYLRIKEHLKTFKCRGGFLRLLSDETLRFRGKVLVAEVIGELGCDKAIGVLRGLMAGDNRDVRRAAIKAIGMFSGDEARDVLVGFLGDHDGHIRKIAIQSLGRMRDHDSFEPLLNRLRVEEYEDVREEIVRALLEIDRKRVFEHLGGFDARDREAIGRHTYDIETLLVLSNAPEPSIKLSALYGLGRVGGMEAEERLISAMKERDAETRRTAVIALGGNICCYSEIKDLLNDPDMWVRLHSVRALGESMKEEMLPVLAAMLKDKDVPVVIAAIEAMAAIGGPRAAEGIQKAQGHRDESVRDAVESALARF